MKIATAKVKSISPYSQSQFVDVPKLEKEAADDYEMRTWRERCHANRDGNLYIPPMAFKKSLETAARFLSMNIKGRGKATYTKHFKAGVLVTDGVPLGVKKDEVEGEVFFVDAQGKQGGSRVKRKFPVVREWTGDVTFYVLDETITRDIFEAHLKEAGNFIGIGRFRPENGGFYGRFSVEKIAWKDAA